MSAAPFLEALAGAAAALEAGDPVAAAAAMERADREVQTLQAAGARLTAEELARGRALQAACEAAARKVAEQLQRSMESAGAAQRALGAYGR